MEAMVMPKNRMRPVHPGEVLGEEMAELNLSSRQLGAALGVPNNRISQIVAGKRALTAGTALRLARYFVGTEPEFWLNLQAAYDLRSAELREGKDIDRTVQPRAAAEDGSADA
jgi:addiction module HigA family antidote